MADRLCAAFAGRPGVVLIDGKTSGSAEVLAAEVRARKCAALAGRNTAGLAMAVERHALATEAVLAVPMAPVRLSAGGALRPEGVIPDRFVPARADGGEEGWREAVIDAAARQRR
jgi:C-terminal processing protease CtpA/Prc